MSHLPIRRLYNKLTPWIALLPMAAITVCCYVGATLWSARISVSSSHNIPVYDFVGLKQYYRLIENQRWIDALENLLAFGIVFITASMIIGVLLAILIDQKIKAETLFRSIFLYPYAMSFIATGIVWQWILNPDSGLQNSMRGLGWTSFDFDWLISQDNAIYAVAIAAVWQASGFVMAIVLAGLRGIDPEIWSATKIDGIATWRVYTSIVIPMLKPTLCVVFFLLATSVIKVYDVVISMTQGGPGMASDVPTKFIMDHLFGRANISLASAGTIMLLAMVLIIFIPVLVWKKHYLTTANHS
jgi:glucose/mannose transport system permease protein